MKTLKGYMRFMAQLEASMAKEYLKDECLGFVTKYFQRFDVVYKQVWDAKEKYGDTKEVLEGVGKPYLMIVELYNVVDQYVLRTNMCYATYL